MNIRLWAELPKRLPHSIFDTHIVSNIVGPEINNTPGPSRLLDCIVLSVPELPSSDSTAAVQVGHLQCQNHNWNFIPPYLCPIIS